MKDFSVFYLNTAVNYTKILSKSHIRLFKIGIGKKEKK